MPVAYVGVADIQDGVPTPVSSLVDLSRCTTLRTLSLSVPTYRDASIITRWLVALLLQVASPFLEEIRFAVHPILRGDAPEAYAMLAAFDWELVTSVLLGYTSTSHSSSHSSSLINGRREITHPPSTMRHMRRFTSLKKVTFCAGRAADYAQMPSAFVSLAPHLRKLASTFFGPLEKRGVQVRFKG